MTIDELAAELQKRGVAIRAAFNRPAFAKYGKVWWKFYAGAAAGFAAAYAIV